MAQIKVGAKKRNPVVIWVMLFFVLAIGSVIWFHNEIFPTSSRPGLSGLVSVRGSVSLADLNLSQKEIGEINRAVRKYKSTFSKVDLEVDSLKAVNDIEPSTVLVVVMELKTTGDLVIKSWERRMSRSELVPHVVSYMGKAAEEYEKFQRFPDIKRSFKTLYI